jgi:predicted transposase YbfD/YdcC
MEPMDCGFPCAHCLVVVRSEVTIKKSGKTTGETRYYLSSLKPSDRTAVQWHSIVRGHWAGVEILNHWRRDALWGEDRSRIRNPNALANLALLRSALLSVLPERFPDLPLCLESLNTQTLTK